MLAAAAAVPLFNPISTHLVSARVRNDQHNPQWGFLPDQAWVRECPEISTAVSGAGPRLPAPGIRSRATSMLPDAVHLGRH